MVGTQFANVVGIIKINKQGLFNLIYTKEK
jgi:hypothetical protein